MGGAVHLRIVHLLSKYSIPAVVCEGLWYQVFNSTRNQDVHPSLRATLVHSQLVPSSHVIQLQYSNPLL